MKSKDGNSCFLHFTKLRYQFGVIYEEKKTSAGKLIGCTHFNGTTDFKRTKKLEPRSHIHVSSLACLLPRGRPTKF